MLPIFEAAFRCLAVKIGNGPRKSGAIDALEIVYVHHRVKIALGHVCDEEHHAAAGTELELGRPRSERALRDEALVMNDRRQLGIAVRGISAAVHGAKYTAVSLHDLYPRRANEARK